jgi:plastocyanin
MELSTTHHEEETMRSFRVRLGGIAAALALAVALGGCGDDPAGPVEGESVDITDNGFDPEDIVVAPGATVTWTWEAGNQFEHSVTFADASITDSPTQLTGTYSTTMPTTPGTYTYLCSEHPAAMTGSVVVQ